MPVISVPAIPVFIIIRRPTVRIPLWWPVMAIIIIVIPVMIAIITAAAFVIAVVIVITIAVLITRTVILRDKKHPSQGSGFYPLSVYRHQGIGIFCFGLHPAVQILSDGAWQRLQQQLFINSCSLIFLTCVFFLIIPAGFTGDLPVDSVFHNIMLSIPPQQHPRGILQDISVKP